MASSPETHIDTTADPSPIPRLANLTSNRILVTTSQEDQENAARKLSIHLDQMNCPHAFIDIHSPSVPYLLNHFLLPRELLAPICIDPQQHDIDVLVEAHGIRVQDLREQIAKIDEHFAETSLFKFYFLREFPPEYASVALSEEDRVRQGRGRVLIETLPTGNVGLPTIAKPVFRSSRSPVPILHPSILILTKLQRWCNSYTSTRRKTRTKTATDQADIDYLIGWLKDNNILISFTSYAGRSREELLILVRIYWDRKLYDGEDDFGDVIKEVLAEEDLNDIIRAQEQEGNLAERALNTEDTPPSEVN